MVHVACDSSTSPHLCRLCYACDSVSAPYLEACECGLRGQCVYTVRRAHGQILSSQWCLGVSWRYRYSGRCGGGGIRTFYVSRPDVPSRDRGVYHVPPPALPPLLGVSSPRRERMRDMMRERGALCLSLNVSAVTLSIGHRISSDTRAASTTFIYRSC